MLNIDLVFILVIAIIVGYYMCKREKFDTVEGFAAIDDARQAVREIYNADIDAIRNLSTVASKLQAGGLTHPGNLTVSNGSLSVNTGRITVNSGADHIPIVAQSNTDSHILLKTKNDANKDSYLVNRDGHFRLHQANVGDMFGVNHDGHHYVRHTGDHVMHVEGDGENPYISLGKTGTWGGKKVYIQNVAANSADPSFRVGVHDKREMMDISVNQGARFKRKDGRVTHLDWVDNKNYIRGDTIVDGNLVVNGTSITLSGPGGNNFTFELSADDSRAHDGGQRMTIKNKHGGRVLDIYQGEVKAWKEGVPEPVTIFSRGGGNHSYLNVRQHGFYTSTNACGNATWGHMGCNLRHALS